MEKDCKFYRAVLASVSVRDSVPPVRIPDTQVKSGEKDYQELRKFLMEDQDIVELDDYQKARIEEEQAEARGDWKDRDN